MHRLDLHVDILYIPNAFLAHRVVRQRNASTRYWYDREMHRRDTGTTEKCTDAIRSDTEPKPWILCRGREFRFRVPTFGTGSCYEPVPKVSSPEAYGQTTWRPFSTGSRANRY